MTLEPDAAMDLMAANYTVVGLVLIYHLFAIQHWLGRVEEAADHAISEYSVRPQGTIEIAYMRSRCNQNLKSFPLADVIILGALILALAVFSYIASCHAMTKAPQFLTLAPVVVMLLAFIIGSVLAWRRGAKKIREALKVLPEDAGLAAAAGN
jgi:VIT1/CCC1 family predicted Fe2+/Mn2+ transporter